MFFVHFLSLTLAYPAIARVAVYYLYHPYNHFALSRPQASINKWVDDEHKMNVQPACDDDGISHHMTVRMDEKGKDNKKTKNDKRWDRHIPHFNSARHLPLHTSRINDFAIDFIIHYIPFVPRHYIHACKDEWKPFLCHFYVCKEDTFQWMRDIRIKKGHLGAKKVRKKGKTCSIKFVHLFNVVRIFYICTWSLIKLFSSWKNLKAI